MPNSQLLEILLIAMVAGIILFRLYSVLGRRTGHEPPPRADNRFAGPGAPANDSKIASLPARGEATAPPADPLARGLFEIARADADFEPGHFVAGARRAHEIISAAFAAGDRNTLRPLLSAEVYAAFDSAIRAREEKHEKIGYTFVGFKDAKITHAELDGRIAEVTVSFAAQFISQTLDTSGAVVAGDAALVRDVTDLWTFSRDVRARDPNWTLVATSGDPA